MVPLENKHSLSRFTTGLPSLLPGRIQRVYNNAQGRIHCDILQGYTNILTGELTCNHCYIITRRSPGNYRTVNVHKVTAGNITPRLCDHCGGSVKYVRDVSECLDCTRQLIEASEADLRAIEFICSLPF